MAKIATKNYTDRTKKSQPNSSTTENMKWQIGKVFVVVTGPCYKLHLFVLLPEPDSLQLGASDIKSLYGVQYIRSELPSVVCNVFPGQNKEKSTKLSIEITNQE